MAVPNPYFIYIELFKADGVTRPNQNEIARVQAYDVNGNVVTWEGQSGFNPSTGGWFPVYMQNIAAFAAREKPNLKFEVWNTQEQLVYTTQVFNLIPSASTVKIVIGVSAEIVGGSSTTWLATGTVRHLDTTPLTTGSVRVYDITNNVEKQLGSTALGAGGTYSVSFATADFASNGSAHTQPNLMARAFNGSGALLGESNFVANAANPQVLDIQVPNETTGPGPGTKRRVFGTVKNPLGLPVSGITVEAYHVAWTIQGIQEFRLGPVSPVTTSNGAGDYEISYDLPVVGTPSNPCGTPADQVNLLVYAKELDAGTLKVLFTSDILFDAPAEQRVDLVVNKAAVSTASEYDRVNDALTPCLGEGATEAQKWATLDQLNKRPEYVTFVSQASGIEEDLIRAYVRAWLISGEINAKVPVPPLSEKMSPEVIYALVRGGLGNDLAALLNIVPDQFFQALVGAIHGGIISADLEAKLPALLEDWRKILAALLTTIGQTWQADLLNLVFPGNAVFPDVRFFNHTLFGTEVTAHNVPMPASIVAGDLLIVLFTSDGNAAVTTPAGWTVLFNSTNGTNVRFSGFAKVAVGTETGTNVNFQTATAVEASAQVCHIARTSWTGPTIADGVRVGTAATGASTTINPPNVALPAWPYSKALWIACAGHDREIAHSSSPLNYTNLLRSNSSTTTGNVTGLSVRRELDVTSEDPGNFVIAATEEWVAQTIAVRASEAVPKKTAVTSAHFDNPGSFADLIQALRDTNKLTAGEAENLTFVFELYDKVGNYYPVVAAVYPDKAARGWKTIADLASVKLDGAVLPEKDWVDYVRDSKSFNVGQLPGDVPGRDDSEKEQTYAQRLFDLFGDTSTQVRFVDTLEQATSGNPDLGPAGAFLAANPEFDLEHGNIDQYLAGPPPITLAPEVVAAIKQIQRVYRLTSDVPAALELIEAGLDSAVKIARLDEGQFIATYEEPLGGLTEARNVYRTAANYSSEVLLTLVKFHQNLNDVGGLAAIPGAVNFSVLDPNHGYVNDLVTPSPPGLTRKFPNWVTLFGDINKCACKHCQTVLSPGAYLVDLLEFVDGAPKRTLFERRPDLVDIELTCTNTHTSLPYIDLVNEVLEAVVAPPSFPLTPAGGSPLSVATLTAATTGSQAALTQVRQAFRDHDYVLTQRAIIKLSAADQPPNAPTRREWVVEDDAWRFAIRGTAAPFAVHPAPQTSATNDALEVFPEHFNVAAYSLLESAVFPFNLPLALGKEEVDVFLKAKNARKHELLEAFTTDTPQTLLDDVDVALGYLNLVPAESDALLALPASRPTWEYWGFTLAMGNESVTIPRPDKPTIKITANSDVVNGQAWIKLLKLVPVFLHRSGLSYQELLDLLDTRFVHVGAADAHGLHIVSAPEDVIECNFNDFQIAHLNDVTLRRISCFLRLWRKLGWTMRELDRYLMAFEGATLQGETIPASLVRLFQVKRLADEFRVPPLGVFSWWRPIDTRRTSRHEKSFFDEVFLIGSPSQPEFRHLELVAQGQTIDLTALEPGEDLKAHVRAALEVKAEDIELLWSTFVVGTALSLADLTAMYRVASFASALRLKVAEFFELVALTGSTPFSATITNPTQLHDAILATYAAIREIRRARATRMSAAEIAYYLRDETEAGDDFVPKPEDLDAAVQRIAAAVLEIATANPEQENVDAAVLGAGLSKVMPADKVVHAIDIVKAATAPTSDDLTFLRRYFAPFLPADPTPFFTALFAEPDIGLRYVAIWDELHGHLIESMRTTLTTAVAAELVELAPDSTDRLLTETLGSLHGRPTAADDWKAFLNGGWDSGEVEIVDAGAGVRHTVLVVPQDGDYRFVVSVDDPNVITPADVTLFVDGVQIGKEPSSATEVVFQPVSLKSGSVLGTTFEHGTNPAANPVLWPGARIVVIRYVGTLDVSLLWRIDNADPVVVPRASAVPFDKDVYLKLFKASGLSRGLELGRTELAYLMGPGSGVLDLDLLPVSDADGDVAWSSFGRFVDLLSLNRSLPLKTGTLFEFWGESGGSATATVDDVAALTEWKAEDIQAVLGLLAPPPPPPWDNHELWFLLERTMRLVRRLDLGASQIIALLVNAPPTIATANVLRNVFRAQFNKQTWKDVFKPLRDPLRQRQRDALTGFLTTRTITRVTEAGTHSYDFIDENDLFAHFLIDVEMEPDTLISRIVLATNAIQLFVQRVFLGLEDDTSLIELEKAKEQWVWMQRYRVWEANRKVFLYPENFIEPELRDDKTEFFTQLEEELLSDEVTSDVGLVALTNYLEKMNEVSNLEVVGTYAEEVFTSGVNYVLHVVGRTRSQSRGFFYRTFLGKQANDGTWTPWKRIELEINADVVAPVVFDGRLFLVWPMLQMKQRARQPNVPIDGNNIGAQNPADQPQHVVEIKLVWSEYVAQQNKWTKPKVSKSRTFDNAVPTPFARGVGDDQPSTDPYHLRVSVPSAEYFAVEVFRSQYSPNTGGLEVLSGGSFQIWYTGDDTWVERVVPVTLGHNTPLGTLLKHNAAEETGAQVAGFFSADQLKFFQSAPFFQRTPGTFRFFGTNFPYLLTPEHRPFFYETTVKSLFALNKGFVTQPGLSQELVQVASFDTFHHPLVREVQKRLHFFGPEGIMNRLTQALPIADNRYYSNYYYNYYGHLYLGYHIAGDTQAWGTTQRLFEAEFQPRADSVMRPYALPTIEFGYGTPFGVYNWELFFHLPMLIAQRLNQDLKFEDAMKWYHYVFDPKQDLNTYEKTKGWVSLLPVGSRYWNFLPFFANKDTTDSLLATLGLTANLSIYEQEQLRALIDEWRRNPFRPHLIARQRIAAYQKNVVMKYLDNLTAWGDSLFRLDTFESINQATQLYILAAELLGDRPEEVEPLTGEPRHTYRELQAQGIDAFANAIVEVENMLVTNQDYLKTTALEPQSSAMTSVRNLSLKTFYFCVPRNDRLDRYWDTVQDRLFKIRNSMNIDGVKRQLALFEPPIDPALLVRAVAAGLDLGSVLSQLGAPLPFYRFGVWIQRAIDLAGEVRSFGAALLAALEKKDAEDLQLLRQRHEIEMLELVRRVRRQQITEAQENIEALERSKALAEERHTFYASRAKENDQEKAQVSRTKAATAAEITSSGLHTLSALFVAVPDVKAGVVGFLPLVSADIPVGNALQAAATAGAHAAGGVAAFARGEAALAGMRAGFDRRWDDFKFQERLAQKEMEQIDQQIVAAQIRLQISELELENHEKQIEQAEEVREFLRDKFTSAELYQWMIRELGRTHQQIYRLAYDVAKRAERTFGFELGVADPGYIQFGYIDSLRRGLLAGEKLTHDLKRMDIAYLERDKRELEITKPISLATINGDALQDLREQGFCEFELPEVLFDLDFPGHYFRRIRGVRITIPCVTGPHTSVSAKLTLLGSAIRKEAAADPNAYPYEGFEDPRFVHDLVGIQSIATSSAQNDAGLFEFNFRDNRYLPFEGAGAVSRWRLELPTAARQFDYHTVSDVVMQLSYTARDAGGTLREGAENSIVESLNKMLKIFTESEDGLVRIFSLKKEFPDVFHRLLTTPGAPIDMVLRREHFPFVLQPGNIRGVPELALTLADGNTVSLHVVLKPGAAAGGATFELNESGSETLGAPTNGIIIQTLDKGATELLEDWEPETWTLEQTGLTSDAVEDLVFIVQFTVDEP